jgi:hypothetical protein
VAIAVLPRRKNLVPDSGKDGVLIAFAAVQKMGNPVSRAGKKAGLEAIAAVKRKQDSVLCAEMEAEPVTIAFVRRQESLVPDAERESLALDAEKKGADPVAVAVAAEQKEKRFAVLVEVEKQHVLLPSLCCGLPC